MAPEMLPEMIKMTEMLDPDSQAWQAYAEIAAAAATAILALLVYFLNRRQHSLEIQNFRLQLLELRTALILRLRSTFEIWIEENKKAIPNVKRIAVEIREIALQIDLLYSCEIAAKAADLFEKLDAVGGNWTNAVLAHARGPNSNANVPPANLNTSDKYLRVDITVDLSELSTLVEGASKIDEKYLLVKPSRARKARRSRCGDTLLNP